MDQAFSLEFVNNFQVSFFKKTSEAVHTFHNRIEELPTTSLISVILKQRQDY